MKILYSFTLMLLLTGTLWAQENKGVNHISLAALMVYDANYKKALHELRLVNQKDENFDKSKFYTLYGVIYSKQNKTKQAIKAYTQAIEATKKKVFKAPKLINKGKKYLFSFAAAEEKKENPIKFDGEKKRQEKLAQLYMSLTQEYYKLKDYKNTVKTLDKAGELGKSRAALYTLRAECYYKQKKYHHAFKALKTGIEKFPKDTKLLKQKFYYFANLKLYQSSIVAAKTYMDKSGINPKEYIALAQMLIGANEIDSAIALLEEAKLMFSKDPKIGILLGHIYLKKEMLYTTAHLFDQSSYYDTKYLKDAVEMNRRAGNNLRALYLNAQNTDKIEKIKQKIAIYLNEEEYRKVIGLEMALERYEMLKNDNLRYALAYSYYMVKDYQNAENHLKFINDNELFSKATVIRKNIEKCTNNTMECL